MLLSKLLPIFLYTFPLFCFAQQDCGENAGSDTKLFVFIGQKVEVINTPSEKDEIINDAKFVATYKIIEKICGDFPGDTITFEVISTFIDSTFKGQNTTLFFLLKNVEENDGYQLWGDAYYDVYKTKDGRWASPLKTNDHPWSPSISLLPAIKRKLLLMSLPGKTFPAEIPFEQEVWYDISGMTREEIHLTYPDKYYKIEGQKAIAVYGNDVPQLFNIQKGGMMFKYWGIYGKQDSDNPVVEAAVLDTYYDSAETTIIEEKPNTDSILAGIKQSLTADPFNDDLISELSRHCRKEDDFEPYGEYFNTLVVKYPDSITAYLKKAKYFHRRPNLEDSTKISVLSDALKIDNNNYEVNYQLGICYYDLFLEYPNSHYATQARKWFTRAAEIDTIERAFLKYPIIQLSNYLNDMSLAQQYKSYQYKVKTNETGVPFGNRYNWYFPFESFLELEKSWETDYKTNFIRELKNTAFTQNWFSSELLAFNEPLLSSMNHDVYRFEWLRSFHVPVAIRLERTGKHIMLYWKMPKYNQDLDIYESYKDGQKKISLKKWDTFEKKLALIDYWNMVTIDHKSTATDGAAWILEASVDGKYKVVERSGYIYPHYTDALMYLLKKSNLNLRKMEIY